jgi:hypothetical protein
MATYILIIMIVTNSGVTTSSATFQNMDACRNAMSVVEGRFDGFLREVFTVCVEDR